MRVANFEQAEYWTGLASTWLELEDRLEEVGGPPGRLAMDRLPLGPGKRVADLGCGLGATTLELAFRVSPGGMAVGIDIAEGMHAAAKERAERRNAAGVSFRLADVQVEDLGTAAFDAAFSRFGVMFFSDPESAFANVHRSIVEGGRLSFVCWLPIFENEWMMVPGLAAMSVTGPIEMPQPGEPGPFSLSDPPRVRQVLEDAGFLDVTIEPHRDSVSYAAERIPELAATSMRVGGLSRALAEADDRVRVKVRAAIEDAMRDRVVGGRVTLSRGVLVVGGTA